MTEEQKHYHIKEIAEDYVSKSWNTFLDLEEIDLVMAGIGVGKIIADEQEKRIAELEAQVEQMKCCSNCDNWNWKHNKCEKKLKGDCFKASKWILRR